MQHRTYKARYVKPHARIIVMVCFGYRYVFRLSPYVLPRASTACYFEQVWHFPEHAFFSKKSMVMQNVHGKNSSASQSGLTEKAQWHQTTCMNSKLRWANLAHLQPSGIMGRGIPQFCGRTHPFPFVARRVHCETQRAIPGSMANGRNGRGARRAVHVVVVLVGGATMFSRSTIHRILGTGVGVFLAVPLFCAPLVGLARSRATAVHDHGFQAIEWCDNSPIKKLNCLNQSGY